MPSGQAQATDAKTGGKKGLSPDRYDLIPAKALEYLALVYGQSCIEHGGKYDARNWEKGYPWGWSIRALFKHALAFVRGAWLDPDSGLPHIIHAAWHCFTLCTYHDYKLGTDDRTPLRERSLYDGGAKRYEGQLETLLARAREDRTDYDIPHVPTREELDDVFRPPDREPFSVALRGKIVELPYPEDVVTDMEAKRRAGVRCAPAIEANIPWNFLCDECNPAAWNHTGGA